MNLQNIAREAYMGRAFAAIQSDAKRIEAIRQDIGASAALSIAIQSLGQGVMTIKSIAEILGFCHVAESLSTHEDMFDSVGVLSDWLEMEINTAVQQEAKGAGLPN